eukprot:g29840.t1
MVGYDGGTPGHVIGGDYQSDAWRFFHRVVDPKIQLPDQCQARQIPVWLAATAFLLGLAYVPRWTAIVATATAMQCPPVQINPQ